MYSFIFTDPRNLDDPGEGTSAKRRRSGPPKKPSKKKHVLWNYFELEPLEKTTEKYQRAICNKCGTIIKRGDGSPSGMRTHLERCHKSLFREFLQKEKEAKLEKLAIKRQVAEVDEVNVLLEEAEGVPKVAQKRPWTATRPMDKYVENNAKYSLTSPLQKRFDLDIMIMLARDNLPFSFVEGEGFRYFCAAHCSKYNIKGRRCFSRKVCPLLYENLKRTMDSLLEKELAGCHSVAFTADEWTSKALHGYLALTIHYINEDFQLRKFTVACRSTEGWTTDIGKVTLVNNMIEDIPSIHGRQTTKIVVTDGAMNKTMKEASKVNVNINCMAHIINNTLKDAFEIHEVLDLVKRVKDLCAATRKSLKKTNLIREKCNELEIDFVKLVQPVETRWNSMFYSMESIVRIRRALKELLDEGRFDETFMAKIPTERMFDSMGEMLKPLKIIQDALLKVQADNQPTLQHALPCILNLGALHMSRACQTASKTTRIFLEAFGYNLKLRLRQLGREQRQYCMANFLHPFFKGKLLKTDEGNEVYDQTIDYIKSLFKDTVPEEEPESDEEEERSQSLIPSQEPELDEWLFYNYSAPENRAAGKKIKKKRGQIFRSITDEIKIYKEVCPTLDTPDGNILQYWHKEQDNLPHLAALAREIFCIPATSASSERCFSEAGNVITDKRCQCYILLCLNKVHILIIS